MSCMPIYEPSDYSSNFPPRWADTINVTFYSKRDLRFCLDSLPEVEG
jgi:hypothetical protein